MRGATKRTVALFLPKSRYTAVPGLTREAAQRLSEVQPRTLGQAARIPGVTPAAVAVVAAHVRRYSGPSA